MKKYVVFFITIFVFFYEIDASQNGKYEMVNMMASENIQNSELDVQIEMINMMERETSDNTEMHNDDEHPQQKSIKFQNFLDTQVCTICTEIPNSEKIYTTKCKHVFCCDCLFEWLKTKQTCPNCRVSLAQDEGLSRRAYVLQWRWINDQASPRPTEIPIRAQNNAIRLPTRTDRVPVISRNVNILFHIFQWSVVSMLFFRLMNPTKEYQPVVDVFGIILTVFSQFPLRFTRLEPNNNYRESDLVLSLAYCLFRIPTFVLSMIHLVNLDPLSMATKLGSFLYELILTSFFSVFEILFRNRVN